MKGKDGGELLGGGPYSLPRVMFTVGVRVLQRKVGGKSSVDSDVWRKF